MKPSRSTERTSPLALTRWREVEGRFEVSWPVLHVASLAARAILLLLLIGPALLVGTFAFIFDADFAETSAKLIRVAPAEATRAAFVVLCVSGSVVLGDYLLRDCLTITTESIELSRAKTKRGSWHRDSLRDIRFQAVVGDPTEAGTSQRGRVHLLLDDGDSLRRIPIGGDLRPGEAEELAMRVRRYVERTA